MTLVSRCQLTWAVVNWAGIHGANWAGGQIKGKGNRGEGGGHIT